MRMGGRTQTQLESVGEKLADIIEEIGYGVVTREDEAYVVGGGHCVASGISIAHGRPLVEGDIVRDFGIWGDDVAVAYDRTYA